jgi:hypothetical protein
LASVALDRAITRATALKMLKTCLFITKLLLFSEIQRFKESEKVGAENRERATLPILALVALRERVLLRFT